ncbi:MAG: hypothetical protein LBQ89_07655 [Treponema sp.]|jgi:hypothetical protein|nr:hypothetical protein [Treponema sp.]
MKKCLLILSILLFSCTNQNQSSGKTPAIPPSDAKTYESNTTESEQIADPLILDGRPFVGYQGKAYRKDEAELITSLTCNFNPDAAVRWHSLEGVEQLLNLKRLTVDGENLSMIDFSPLSPLSNLESLYFEGITHLPNLTVLKQQLTYIGIRSSGQYTQYKRDSRLENLDGIGAPNVRRINIENRGVGINSLAPLNNLPYLEDLVINGRGSTTLRIADMSNLPSLKRLDLHMPLIPFDLQGIENLQTLEDLRLSDNNTFNIEGIGKLKNLRRLTLKLVSPEPSLEFLRNMPNLSYLGFVANKSEPYQVLDVSPLATLKNLRRLGCTGFIIKNIATLDILDALSEASGHVYLAGSKFFDKTDKSRHPLVFEYPVRE